MRLGDADVDMICGYKCHTKYLDGNFASLHGTEVEGDVLQVVEEPDLADKL